MSLMLSKSQGELYRFKKAPPKYQHTYHTPLEDLSRFVATMLSPFDVIDASITIDQVVFAPKNLLKVLSNSGIQVDNLVNAHIRAAGRDDVRALLETALGDWVDFLFMPSPYQFALYADHDERATAFASTESDLGVLNAAMIGGGYEVASSYTRF